MRDFRRKRSQFGILKLEEDKDDLLGMELVGERGCQVMYALGLSDRDRVGHPLRFRVGHPLRSAVQGLGLPANPGYSNL